MYIIDSRRLVSSHSGSSALQRAVLVAVDADDRVEQAMDGQLARGDRVGDGIDQEGHVVVDDADPHPPPAGLAAGRFERDRDFAGFRLRADVRRGSRAASCWSSSVEARRFPREARSASALCGWTKRVASRGAYGPS